MVFALHWIPSFRWAVTTWALLYTGKLRGTNPGSPQEATEASAQDVGDGERRVRERERRQRPAAGDALPDIEPQDVQQALEYAPD